MLRNKGQKYTVCVVILAALMFTAFAVAPATAINPVFNASNETQQQQDVSFNSKINDYGVFSEWAVSINVSDLVSLEYSTLISTYNSSEVDIIPILSFLSENVYINDTHTLYLDDIPYLFEAFNDTNGNGIPDTFTEGDELQTEVVAIVIPFGAPSYELHNVTKKVNPDGSMRFDWGIKYINAAADAIDVENFTEWFNILDAMFLLAMMSQEQDPQKLQQEFNELQEYEGVHTVQYAVATIDFLEYNYTFIYDPAANTTKVKYSLGLGPMTFRMVNLTFELGIDMSNPQYPQIIINQTIEDLGTFEPDLTGFGLTSVHISDMFLKVKQTEETVSDFNLTIGDTNTTVDPENLPFLYETVSNLSISSGGLMFGNFEFTDNYKLLPDNVEYPARVTICKNESLWWLYDYKNLFEEEVGYYSMFSYRISYGTWSNDKTILHDPTIILYIGGTEESAGGTATQGTGNENIETEGWLIDFFLLLQENSVVAMTGILVIVLALLAVSRRRKVSKYNYTF